MSLLILGLVVLFFKEIQAILYDREVALSVGLPEKKLYYVMVFVLGSDDCGFDADDRGAADRRLCPPSRDRRESRLQEPETGVFLLFSLWFDLRNGGALSCPGVRSSDEFHDHPGGLADHRMLHSLPTKEGFPCEEVVELRAGAHGAGPSL